MTNPNLPISFARGVPPTEALMHAMPLVERGLSKSLAQDTSRVLQYGQQSGYPPLREQLAAMHHVKSENILVSNGSLQLFDLITDLLTVPGDSVITEQPTYDRALATFKRRGLRVQGINLQADGLDIDALENAVRTNPPKFIYLIPDFQNPTGVTMSAAKRQAIVTLAERYGFMIIEDIPYRQLRFSGNEVPSLRELNEDRVISVSSFSKLISPGMRVGYAVADQHVIRSLTRLAEETYLSPVLPTQAAIADVLETGALQEHIGWLKDLYRPRLDALVQSIRLHMPKAQFAHPGGGFFVGLTLDHTAHTGGLVERAKSVALDLTPGSVFFTDGKPKEITGRFIRLPFCALAPNEIDEGIIRLAKLTGEKSHE